MGEQPPADDALAKMTGVYSVSEDGGADQYIGDQAYQMYKELLGIVRGGPEEDDQSADASETTAADEAFTEEESKEEPSSA
jgi:hypothetical protein